MKEKELIKQIQFSEQRAAEYKRMMQIYARDYDFEMQRQELFKKQLSALKGEQSLL